MTPEELQQVAQLRAAALRGQEPQMTRDADVLTGVGGALAGLGGRSVAAMSSDMTGRGNLLRQLASQQEVSAQKEAGDTARSIFENAGHRDIAAANNVAEMERLKLQLGAKEKGDKADAAGKISEREDKYRTQLFGLQPVKDAMSMAGAYQGIKTALASDNPASHMAAIFQFMKIMDPTSSVREGEYATAQNATNVPTQILNMYNKARTGKLLDKTQQRDFLSTAQGRYTSQLREAKKYADAFSKLAADEGGNPERIPVGLDFSSLQPEVAGAPGPPQIKNDAEFDALPPGPFIDPEGKPRIKQ